MSISIISITRREPDVALLYDSIVVFADSISGARHIAEQADRNRVPFATLAVPDRLRDSLIPQFLNVYYHSVNDCFADKFVFDRHGAVFATQFDDARAVLPSQEFWRVIAAMYRLNSGVLLHA